MDHLWYTNRPHTGPVQASLTCPQWVLYGECIYTGIVDVASTMPLHLCSPVLIINHFRQLIRGISRKLPILCTPFIPSGPSGPRIQQLEGSIYSY